MQWPHEILPTEKLVYVRESSSSHTLRSSSSSSLPLDIPSSISSGGGGTSIGLNNKPFPVSRDLDEATGERILSYHYHRRLKEGSSGLTDARTEHGVHKIPINATSRFAESFYVPQQSLESTASTGFTRGVGGGSGPGLFNIVADKLGWVTSMNVKLITKSWLIENGYTVRELMLECDVKISELFAAGIICTYGDLLQLKFTMNDLKLNCARNLLFLCSDLKQLFGVTAQVLASAGKGINIFEEPHFYAQELVVLDYSLGETVEAKAINRDLLRSLNYAPSDLYELKLRKTHLKQLKISKERALTPYEKGGLGWNETEWNMF